jgi:hypothetical protein
LCSTRAQGVAHAYLTGVMFSRCPATSPCREKIIVHCTTRSLIVLLMRTSWASCMVVSIVCNFLSPPLLAASWPTCTKHILNFAPRISCALCGLMTRHRCLLCSWPCQYCVLCPQATRCFTSTALAAAILHVVVSDLEARHQ